MRARRSNIGRTADMTQFILCWNILKVFKVLNCIFCLKETGRTSLLTYQTGLRLKKNILKLIIGLQERNRFPCSRTELNSSESSFKIMKSYFRSVLIESNRPLLVTFKPLWDILEHFTRAHRKNLGKISRKIHQLRNSFGYAKETPVGCVVRIA